MQKENAANPVTQRKCSRQRGFVFAVQFCLCSASALSATVNKHLLAHTYLLWALCQRNRMLFTSWASSYHTEQLYNEPWCPRSYLFCWSTCCYHPLLDVRCHSNTTPTATPGEDYVELCMFYCEYRCLPFIHLLTPPIQCLPPPFLSISFSPSHAFALSKLYLLSCAPVWPTHTLTLCVPHTLIQSHANTHS